MANKLMLAGVPVTAVPVRLAYLPDPTRFGKKDLVLRGTPGSFGDADVTVLDMGTPERAAALVREWPLAATPCWRGFQEVA